MNGNVDLSQNDKLTGEILVSGDWVLVEYMQEDEIWLPTYMRGWVPIDSLYKSDTENKRSRTTTD